MSDVSVAESTPSTKRKYTRRDEAELHDIADVEVIVGKLPPE